MDFSIHVNTNDLLSSSLRKTRLGELNYTLLITRNMWRSAPYKTVMSREQWPAVSNREKDIANDYVRENRILSGIYRRMRYAPLLVKEAVKPTCKNNNKKKWRKKKLYFFNETVCSRIVEKLYLQFQDIYLFNSEEIVAFWINIAICF